MSYEQFREWLRTQKVTHRHIRALVIHHFGSPSASQWRGQKTIDAVRNYHVHIRKWRDIGYHFIIGPDGTVWTGRDTDSQGAHCDKNHGNVSTIGIAFAANFNVDNPLTNGYVEGIYMIAELCRFFGFKSTELWNNHVVFHSMWDETACPGKKLNYKYLIRDVESLLSAERMLSVDGRLIPGAQARIIDGKMFVDPQRIDALYPDTNLAEIRPLLAKGDVMEDEKLVAIRPYLRAKGRSITAVKKDDFRYLVTTVAAPAASAKTLAKIKPLISEDEDATHQGQE